MASIADCISFLASHGRFGKPMVWAYEVVELIIRRNIVPSRFVMVCLLFLIAECGLKLALHKSRGT